MDKRISVFQELTLRSDIRDSFAIRNALIAFVKAPWTHDEEREQRISGNSQGDDVIAFAREAGDQISSAILVMRSEGDTYDLKNVIPLESRELSSKQYNAILRDFVSKIATPSSSIGSFQVIITEELQSLSDWIAPDIAQSLEYFSAIANKSTGSSHPQDRKNWCDFIVLSHRSQKRINTYLLLRWLVEVEHWSEEEADKLAVEYEFGIDLLTAYDESSTDDRR